MDTIKSNTENFDEKQSLQIIKAMIQVSHRKIKNDGILLIIWGWIWFLGRLSDYLFWTIPHTQEMKQIKNIVGFIIFILALFYTIFYIYKQRRRVATYIDISLRYIWLSLIFGMSLISMILYNVLKEPNFELQHPIFMVFIAFAIVATGGILRYRLLIIGGIVFAALAYFSSFFAIQEQMLIESFAWLTAFVIPGHLMFTKRNK